MSHINDMVALLRGARLVAEAGAKLQQEQARVLWTNSSLKSVFQNCSTNQINILKPNQDGINEIVEKAGVVVRGFKEYMVLQTPNSYVDVDRSAMEPELKDEIEELNREFNKTVAKLEKMNVSQATFNPNIVAPLERIATQAASPSSTETNMRPKPQPEPIIVNPSSSSSYTSQETVAKPVVKKKVRVSLSKDSKPRVVPSSRLGRMFSFGSLAAGLGVGTVAQYARNTFSKKKEEDSLSNTFLSTANAERIVDTLCKVRGAALKLGQLLSIQDESVIPPELQRIFERVRQSADFMPTWQVEQVLIAQLGPDWRSKVQAFEEKPFAAASIGQVHLAVLHNGTEAAVKVQYPGVAKGIDSDIDNLVGVLKIWNVFPKGMFIDNVVYVAKKELAWEVDYIREAECTRKFKQLLAPYPEYYVPDVVDELSSSEVITTELIDGVPLEKFFEAEYETRYDIARKVMLLCLREMFVLRCMQTDPNWANFFYNPNTKQVVLLDFGATREYSKEFMDQYIEIIKAASDSDRDAILRMSKEMKFLTGYESKVMEETHVDMVMIMGEVFTTDDEFDFGAQLTTRRIQALVPTVLNERLCPPPEEIYSIHRKLSGVFLLCAKMKIKMNCRDMFMQIYKQYKNNEFR